MTKRILTTEEKPGVRTAVLVPVVREAEEGAEESHEIEMSFSSEEPVDRWGYEEVLDHSARKRPVGAATAEHAAALQPQPRRPDREGRTSVAWR